MTHETFACTSIEMMGPSWLNWFYWGNLRKPAEWIPATSLVLGLLAIM